MQWVNRQWNDCHPAWRDRLSQLAGLHQVSLVDAWRGREQAGGDEPPTQRGGIRDALDGRCVAPPEGGDEV